MSFSIQHIVSPTQIEPKLVEIWEHLGKEKIRACLFNLIVFNRLSSRTDYIRNIVQKVSEKFPCRVLFISVEEEASLPFLKTAVSVIGEGSIACDYIDIGVSGPDQERVPFLILPHLIPDLPVSLLWAEDPSVPHPLFEPLSRLASRIIFDSESAYSLPVFAKAITTLKNRSQVDIADLNWARIEGWRDLLSSILYDLDSSDSIKKLILVYNAKETPSFCHSQIQAMYLLAWIRSRLSGFKKETAEIQSQNWEQLGPGAIISIEIVTEKERKFSCFRDHSTETKIWIQKSNLESCELPHCVVLGKKVAGPSLIQEIINKGTSTHYLDMLRFL